MFVPDNVDQNTLQRARDSGDFLFFPTYLAAYTWMLNPTIAPGVDIAGQKLRLDLHTIGLIWYACLFHLNDPRILAQNEWLLPLIGDMETNPVPIQSIVGCGTTVAAAPISNSLNNLLNAYAEASHDVELASCIANYSLPDSEVIGGATSWNDANNQCMSGQHAYTALCSLAIALADASCLLLMYDVVRA